MNITPRPVSDGIARTSARALVERYRECVDGELRCWDRMVFTGTWTDVCHSGAMEGRLRQEGIRCFDLKTWAQPLTDAIRTRAQQLAAAHSVQIEYIGKKRFRKEDRVAAVLKASGGKTGLIHIFSALEPCTTFKPWHDKTTGRTGLKMTAGQCLHYYFYFNDAQLGLCHLRVQSWAPFRLQLCLNGHNWLARWMDQKGMTYKMEDNAFVQTDDWAAAQEMASALDPARLHTAFERLRREVIPFAGGNDHFRSGVYWSVMQIEMSHDIIFKSQASLAPVYETISRQAMLAVKAPEVARFLGKPLPRENSSTPLSSDYHTRIEGTRIKHSMGPASLKMYDKRGRVLRIECTCNDITFFKHHREVEKRDGTTERKTAPLKKSLYSLPDLRGLMEAACRRYLDFVSTLEDSSAGSGELDKITRTARDKNGRGFSGINLFRESDIEAVLAVLRGEHHVSGLTRRGLARLLPGWSGSRLGRLLKRLRLHGLVKKIGRTYKYYTTKLGQRVLITGLKLKEALIIPTLCPHL